MVPIQSVLYEMLPIQNVTIQKCTIQNVTDPPPVNNFGEISRNSGEFFHFLVKSSKEQKFGEFYSHS